MQERIVGVGIDTVKINVKLVNPDGKPSQVQVLSEHLASRCDLWQQQARERKKPVATTMTFQDARLTMLPNGAPAWKYLLRNDCLEVKLAPRLDLPMVAKVTLLSAYLWRMNRVQDAVSDVHVFLMDLFGEHIGLQAAQIDMCVDVAGFCMPKHWERFFVSHARHKNPIKSPEKDREHYWGRELETLIFSGHGRPVNCKIYNKTLEITQKSPEKRWFYDIWRRAYWDGKANVWRLEFSLERAGLHEMRLEDIYETLSNLKRIWAYCTQIWLRMVKPGKDTNWRRWPTAEIWLQVQHAFDDYGNKALDELGPIVRRRIREANMERGVAQAAGLLTTLGAWEETELDPENCAAELFSLAYDKVVERWARLGLHPQDMIREKKFIYSQKA